MKEVLKKLNETRLIAEDDTFPSGRTRSGWEMRRRNAQSELPNIRAEFRKEFKKVGFPVFIQGPGAEKFVPFAKVVVEDVVSIPDLFVDFRKAVRSNIGRGGEFGVAAFTAIVRELRQVGAELGLTSIPSPAFKDVEYVGNDDSKIDAIVNGYLMDSVGPDFLSSLLESRAFKEAEDEGLDGEQTVVPVVIGNIKPDVANAVGPKIFGGKYLVVDVPETVDEEFIINTFEKIKEALKSQTSSQN